MRCGMPYVNQRWLGGMLTNFQTVAGRVEALVELEAMQPAGDFDRDAEERGAVATSASSRSSIGTSAACAGLDRPPDAIFVIDTKKEHIAVTEANKLRPAGRGRGRHQLRPGRDRLRDPGQRRRHPVGHAHVPGHRRRRRRRPLHRFAAPSDAASRARRSSQDPLRRWQRRRWPNRPPFRWPRSVEAPEAEAPVSRPWPRLPRRPRPAACQPQRRSSRASPAAESPAPAATAEPSGAIAR